MSAESEQDLFSNLREKRRNQRAPLAHRRRPTSLEEFVGQERVLGSDKPLRKWIESDRVPSLVFWGPPGSGKTTLAQIIAKQTQAYFVAISAVLAGVRDIKSIAARAEETSKTILFVDEIHRFSKSQQDALLPHIENGVLTLIGATTENPSFELNSALLSRVKVIRLEMLDPDRIATILERAIADPNTGLAKRIELTDEAINWIAQTCEGDARRALTTLENLALFFPDGTPEPLSVEQTKEALESALERQPIPYDKNGEEHYNVISAFIKSLRDSDPDAGLYYLARMLEGGEDPLFIARRLVILASEDIGNADPRALQIAIAAKDALEFIGMPEGRINLAQAVTYLAVAPKSNASYSGIDAAWAEVRRSGALPVPLHLRNAVTKLMKNYGYGNGYQYAHQFEGAKVSQEHLPKGLEGKRYYHPKESGFEKQIKERLDWLRRRD